MRKSLRIAKEHFKNKNSDYNAVIGVEVGVCTGKNALDMLENFPKLGILHLIDPYTGRNPHYYAGARELLSPYEHRIIWHIVNSEYAVRRFVKDTLDFVYLDGGHSYGVVKQDCEQWYPKIVSNGILCGHDYKNISRVKLAVDEFAKKINRQLHIGGEDWWIFKE